MEATESSLHGGPTSWWCVCTWSWLLEDSTWLMVPPVGTQLSPKLGWQLLMFGHNETKPLIVSLSNVYEALSIVP